MPKKKTTAELTDATYELAQVVLRVLERLDSHGFWMEEEQERLKGLLREFTGEVASD
jgi:hypothetical protein